MSSLFKRHRASVFSLILLLTTIPSAAQVEPLSWGQGGVGLGLALRRLPVTGRVLYVTAHPDDENNAVLVALSRGRGLETALLTLTRGEGGQNAIGPETGEALGVLRTEELLAVHRYDGVRQFFGAAYDFGFSFGLDETLAKWDHDQTLGDVVYVIRSFRPDVILTLPTEAPDHQHHVAAARLAAEAFRAAADPKRFPEQVAAGLRPWQARAIYSGGVGGGNEMGKDAKTVTVRASEYDPLLGLTWAEVGSLSRTMHKCQASRQVRAGPGDWPDARYVPVDSEPPLAGAPTDVLDGVDTSLRGLARFATAEEAPGLEATLARLESEIQSTLEAFDVRAPHKSQATLAAALETIRGALRSRVAAVAKDVNPDELVRRLREKEEQIRATLALAHGLAVRATTDAADVVPGGTLRVRLRVYNPGPEAVRLAGATLTAWEALDFNGVPDALPPGESATASVDVVVPETARITRPFWHRRAGLDRYDVEIPADRALPWNAPDLAAVVRYRTTNGLVTYVDAPVVQRYEGRWVGGEKQKVVNVVPALSLGLSPEIAVFPLGTPVRHELRLTVRNNAGGEAQAMARLEVPAGWTVEPREALVRLAAAGDESVLRFSVTPPPGLRRGEQPLAAVVTRGGRDYRDTLQVVAYDHIQERHLTRLALARALALDVHVASGVSVGYVMGSGDEVPEALRQIGVPVTFLAADDLAFGDLSRFTTIVTGIRAYGVRQDLRAHQDRLKRYAEQGGHIVVQYNRAEFNVGETSPYAPYPARVTSSRITDEAAPVVVLLAEHPFFTTPNLIAPRDWEGWVQERGIQLLEARDPRYADLLAAADPFPLNPGRKTGLLVDAPVGKGTWTYVGLALWRQLPAGTPGAYRLLANLVSRPRGR